MRKKEEKKKKEGVNSIIFITENWNILLLLSSYRMPTHSSGKVRLHSYSRYLKYMISYNNVSGPGSSVGIAIDYGNGRSGIESR